MMKKELTIDEIADINDELFRLERNIALLKLVQIAVGEGGLICNDLLDYGLYELSENMQSANDNIAFKLGIKSTETVPEKSGLEVYPLK